MYFYEKPVQDNALPVWSLPSKPVKHPYFLSC